MERDKFKKTAHEDPTTIEAEAWLKMCKFVNVVFQYLIAGSKCWCMNMLLYNF